MDTTCLFSDDYDNHLDIFQKGVPILDETTIMTSSPPPASTFIDFYSPLEHDHSYGISTNSSLSDLTFVNYRTLKSDDYQMLLELLSSNTNDNSPPAFFGSALIDPSTPTPYSDATCTKPKKRLRPDHVKRPMNAFMVFSQIERRKMVQLAPHLPNADISKCCGAKWKRMSLHERQPYIEESERLKYLHAQQYPTYKYQPRKRNKSNPSTQAVVVNQELSQVPSTSNSNDSLPRLVSKLTDQKLVMFAGNLQHHHIPPLKPISFDPVAFLATQQQHRLV